MVISKSKYPEHLDNLKLLFMSTLPILRAVLIIKLRTITYTNLQPSTKYIHIGALKLENS